MREIVSVRMPSECAWGRDEAECDRGDVGEGRDHCRVKGFTKIYFYIKTYLLHSNRTYANSFYDSISLSRSLL